MSEADRPTVMKRKEAQLIELSSELRPGHLAIAIGLVEGKTQKQAYIDAGYSSTDCANRAGELIRYNPPITRYVTLAQEIAALKAQDRLIATCDQKREILWKIAKVCSEFASLSDDELSEVVANKQTAKVLIDPKTAISAIAELNKMDGDLAATRTEVSAPSLASSSGWVIEGVQPGTPQLAKPEEEIAEGELV